MDVTRYAKKRFKLLGHHLESYGQSTDIVFLHEIRLEIKKIKSLLQLTEFSLREFKGHKHYKPFRAIFRMAGDIREPEVFYGLLLQYGIEEIEDRRIPQSNDEITLSQAFQERIPSFNRIIKKNKRKLIPYFSRVYRTHVTKYLRNKKGELGKRLLTRWNPGVLHKARKVAKEIIYLSTIVKRAKRKLDPFYEKTQNAIGWWHDKQMLMPLLKENGNPELRKIQLESRENIRQLRKSVSDFYR